MSALLDVRDLRVRFPGRNGPPSVPVDGVSFTVARGEMVALVGESGCGKSLTALALARLLPPGAELDRASAVHCAGTELTALPERAMRAWRGARIAMVFQDPWSSLNPVMRVGDQIVEAIRAHASVPRATARARAVALLAESGIADPEARAEAWPHQLSGGMRQRVMLAIALAADPDILVADEPTTALDVTVQAAILAQLDALRRARGLAVLLVTHDLAIALGRADRVLVMYAGRLVETAPAATLATAARHPYTRGLLAAIPRLDPGAAAPAPIPGAVPGPDRWPSGCRFHPRCPVVRAHCREAVPPLEPLDTDDAHAAACWIVGGGDAA